MFLPRSILVFLGACSLLVLNLSAQEQQPPTQQPVPTVQDIEARINAVQAAESLTEDQKTAILEALAEARRLVPLGNAARAEAERFAAELASRPEELTRVQAALDEPDAETQPDPGPDATLQDLQQSATAARSAAATAAEELATLTQEIQDRPARRAAMPQRITDVEAELEALGAEPEPNPDDPPHQNEARRTSFLARRFEMRQRLASLQNELARDEGGRELLTASRDLAARRAAETDALAGAWEGLVQTRREEESRAAEARAADALREADHDFLVKLAEGNSALAERRGTMTEALARADQEKQQVERDLQELSGGSDNLRGQIENIGLTEAIGELLRERLEELVDTRTYDLRNAARRTERGEVLVALNSHQDERQTLVDDPSRYLDRLLDDFQPPISNQVQTQIRPRAEELLQARREDLEALLALEGPYLRELVSLDTTERNLLKAVDEYALFITEKVLWIRSTTPFWNPKVEEFGQALEWFMRPEQWAEMGRALVADARELSTSVTPTALVLVLLLLLRRRIRNRIQTLGEQAGRFSTVSFLPTGNTLLLTLLLAAPLPVFVWLCGRALGADPGRGEFALAAGSGLQAMVRPFFAYLFLRETMRPGALADAHFQWNPRTLRLFLTNLRWLFPISLPTQFLLGALDAHGHAPWSGALGRLVLVVQLLAIAVFFWRILHPRTGIRGEAKGAGLFDRFRRFWFLLGVGVPVGLTLLSLLGYQFTSMQLFLRLRDTLALVNLSVFASALILRLLALSRRKLSLKQAHEQMEAAAARKEGGGESPPPAIKLDLSSIDLQTRKLLRASLSLFVMLGSWGIWIDVLPALGFLQTVEIWADDTVTPAVSVTLASVLVSLVWVVMTVLAAKNIPGALEMLVLQRLKIRPGERNAITTITRYALLLIGIVGAFSAIGIGWGKVQWLAAAVSVGLGFGLQEIFANFVSGLIILFERPVRVGDLVTVGTATVGTTDGFVTRIQMRATTVTDFNRRELIIPNKQFITGSIINWSLSDPMIRVVVKVGVAFGTDTEKAKKILLQIADANPLILKRPEPMAVFTQFGENTLDLELRAFLPSRDERPQASDELHTRIDVEFRKAGIEIALPQRDINIRTETATEWMRGQGSQTTPQAEVDG